MMLEYWVEHYHQVAHRYDVYWRGMTNTQKQAELRARRETMLKNTGVKKESKRVRVKYVGVRKRKQKDATLERNKRLKCERDDSVTQMMELLASASTIGQWVILLMERRRRVQFNK